ncbi:SH3 domain-containing protein [Janthinobacterium sp. 17J80-10]|uniref:SH3 domain-containing protein n=1 Tax=Janthinobacterium sp. 17J80-10 TaxID=2497863 RepID=UPI00100553A0|nr:SH3 domain-containing protein [Janthinobacterium sp. 17J80-10]QAU35727.1 SH3 domain-containing protein [Janthinobacterium sp. 17J80-10]
MMRGYGLALLLLACAAQAEPALTSRATDLMAQPQSDANKLASLAENDRVEVLRRSGAWSEVKTGAGQAGWVRMMHLKPSGAAGKPGTASSNPADALANLLGSGRRANNATVTTGVRGLTKEELQNAHANPEEFKKMQRYAVAGSAGQEFARRSKLAPTQLGYLEDAKPAAAPSPAGDMVPGMGGG